MYTKIIDLYESRKRKLSGVLSNRQGVTLENQHQIYGAINEIDLFLKTLREYQDSQHFLEDQENSDNDDDSTNTQDSSGATPDKIKPNNDDELEKKPKGKFFSRFLNR